MRPTLARTLRSAAVAASLALPLSASPLLPPSMAMAQTLLPAPYLSHALDALLLPVNDDVRATFGLDADATGVFVLAVAPGGLAESAGLQPGDVLDYVQGTEILSPADLDAIIWNWLQQGVTEYTFDGRRSGTALATTTVITVEYWEETVDITTITSWSSYSSESFSYEEYTAEYSEEITTTYEEESFESTSEETTSEETATEDTETDESVTEEAGATEDEACAGEIVDGVCQDAADEAVDDGMADEGADDSVDEGGDDPVDEGGDEGGGEEEIVE